MKKQIFISFYIFKKINGHIKYFYSNEKYKYNISKYNISKYNISKYNTIPPVKLGC